MGNNLNKNVILGRLKQFYGFTTNKELADFLGVANNTITNQIRRNTIDYELIFSKCEDIDINWLLSDENAKHEPLQISDIKWDAKNFDEITTSYRRREGQYNLFYNLACSS